MVIQHSRAKVRRYLRSRVSDFQEARIGWLKSLKSSELLGENIRPYLLNIGPFITPRQRLEAGLGAVLSIFDEAMLEEVLKDVAIFLCQEAYGGLGKATSKGIDLEFEKAGVRYLVAIKSGPNWGNSAQIKRMRDNFRQAVRIYRQGANAGQILCVNGCCYGKLRPASEDQGDYLKLCGQRFWEFITGDAEIYKRIIKPIGEKTRERSDAFLCQCEKVVDSFIDEFRSQFCDPSNNINWGKMVEVTSGKPDEAAEPASRGRAKRRARVPRLMPPSSRASGSDPQSLE